MIHTRRWRAVNLLAYHSSARTDSAIKTIAGCDLPSFEESVSLKVRKSSNGTVGLSGSDDSRTFSISKRFNGRCSSTSKC